MDREQANKSAVILELIADLRIAVEQLREDSNNARTKLAIAEDTIDTLRTEKRCAEIKMDRVLIRLQNWLKEGVVISKEDVQECIDLIENDK